MPIFDFVCDNGHREEALFMASDTVPDHATCECGAASHRSTVAAIRVLGPVWDKLSDLSVTYGREIKSQKDIDAWEKEHKLHRRSAYENKVAKEEEGHISAQITRVARDQGSEAAADKVKEINMCEALNWTPQQYTAFQEQSSNVASKLSSRIASSVND